MAKTRKTAAAKRRRELRDALQEEQAEQVAQRTAVPDEQLFVVDRTGDASMNSTKRAKVETEHESRLSAQEQRQIDQLVSKHSVEALQKMAQPKAQRKQRGARTPTNYDLWASEEAETTTNTNTSSHRPVGGIKRDHVVPKHQAAQRRSLATPVLLPAAGQSYQPDPKAHQQTLQQAFQVEERRHKAQKYLETPISQGLLPETRALLVGSDDDNSDDDASIDGGPVGPLPERTDKLTRAQRNKQKRLRVQRAIEDKARKNKKLLKQVGEIPRYKKELQKQQDETPQIKKEPKVYQPDPLTVPTLPFALQSAGSLRTVRPKGDLLGERLEAWRVKGRLERPTGQAPSKRKRKIRVKKDNDFGING